jgi:site-specific DNA-cytosine methylase
MCENDKRCRQFLKKTWPGIPIIGDVREFDGSKWTGAFILTGGVPCQPASRAGKQRGKEDDRWLWPEAIRVVSEAKPCWCLFENPVGLYDVGIDGILADLESIGYETGTVEIPACAVGSPQRRPRIWILAHARKKGHQNVQFGRAFQETRGIQSHGSVAKRSKISRQGDMADTFDRRPQGTREQTARHPQLDTKGDVANTRGSSSKQRRPSADDEKKSDGPRPINERLLAWDAYLWTPCADGKLRRTPDNAFLLASRLYPGLHQQVGEEKEIGLHRSILAALGNSIVPQVAYEIIKAIKGVGQHGSHKQCPAQGRGEDGQANLDK